MGKDGRTGRGTLSHNFGFPKAWAMPSRRRRRRRGAQTHPGCEGLGEPPVVSPGCHPAAPQGSEIPQGLGGVGRAGARHQHPEKPVGVGNTPQHPAGNGRGSARGKIPAKPGARGQFVSMRGPKPSGGAARNGRRSPLWMGPQTQHQRRGWGWSGLGRMRAPGGAEDGERGVEAPLRSGGDPLRGVFLPPSLTS